MAHRRMLAIAIIDSDTFLEMSPSAQALYFHLTMRADDDGFVNSPKKIQRMADASDAEMKSLADKRFIIMFDSGVLVIRHWPVHNHIPPDRYSATMYAAEKNLLAFDESGAYTLCGGPAEDACQQSGDKMETQVRSGKVSPGKVSQGKRSRSRVPCAGDCHQDNAGFARVASLAVKTGLPWRAAMQRKANELAEGYGLEQLLQAIERVSLRDRQNWGLVEGILKSWAELGGIDEPWAKHSADAGKPAAQEEQPNWVISHGH